MVIKFDDIEIAFEFVSSGPQYENYAVIDRKTGRIHYSSEISDIDEIPDDIEEEPERYIGIPHKNDLELGRNLVFEFCYQFLPQEIAHVQNIFSRKGAYCNYKDLLDSKGLLDKWYTFEEEQKTLVLKNWCVENKINISA